MHYLSLAEKAGLNVADICMSVVRNIRDAFEPAMDINRSFLSTTSASEMENGLGDQTTLVAATMTKEISEVNTLLNRKK